MSDAAAFSMLVDMAEKSRALSVPLPEVESAQTHSTGLGFNLLDQRFVSSMEDVSELMRVPQVSRIPGVKNFVVGVSNVRGRLMTVIDLALFFGQASARPRAQRRVLAIEDEENLLGFMIDDSFGMQHFPSDAFSEKAGDVPEMFANFVQGSYQIAGVVWPVLSLATLSGDPRLGNLAMAAN